MGLESGEVNRLFVRPGAAEWRDSEFEIGRAPFGSRYCAVWRALFESSAPVERASAPVYIFLIRSRGSLLRGEFAPNRTDAQAMAFETVSSSRKLGVSPTDLESVLRAYVDDIPAPAVPTIAQRDELVGPSGRLEPLGVIAGMVFAMVTRASYGSHLKWFQSVDWWKVSRMLRAPPPSPKTEESLCPAVSDLTTWRMKRFPSVSTR